MPELSREWREAVAMGRAYVMQEHQSERMWSQLWTGAQIGPGYWGQKRVSSFCSLELTLSTPDTKPVLSTWRPAGLEVQEPVGLASRTQDASSPSTAFNNRMPSRGVVSFLLAPSHCCHAPSPGSMLPSSYGAKRPNICCGLYQNKSKLPAVGRRLPKCSLPSACPLPQQVQSTPEETMPRVKMCSVSKGKRNVT